jgi:hypothetical protein
MKKTIFFLFFFLLTIAGGMYAQADLTSWIINPSFESETILEGWVVSPTPPGGVNAEDRGGNHGLMAFWTYGNLSEYGDYELSQTVVNLDEGLYRVQCLLSGLIRDWDTVDGVVAPYPTRTTQRLFAGNSSDGYKSQFFGTVDQYSTENLAIIGATETYSFAGHDDNTQVYSFKEMSVDVRITNGILTFGIRTEGGANTKGLTFSRVRSNGGLFNADHFRLTKLPEVSVNYAVLQALVTKCSQFLAEASASSNYPQVAIDRFQLVINASQAMITGREPSQATVDAQVVTLQAALDEFKASFIVTWTYIPGTNENLLAAPVQFLDNGRYEIIPTAPVTVPSDKLFLVVHGTNLTSYGVFMDEVNNTGIGQDNFHAMKVVRVNEATGECFGFINIPHAAQYKYPALSDGYLNDASVSISQIKIYVFKTGTGEIDHAGFYSAGELLSLCPGMADFLTIDGENFYDLYFTKGGRGVGMPAYFCAGSDAPNDSGVKVSGRNEYGLTPAESYTWAENAAATITNRADKYLAISTLKENLGNATLKIDFMNQTVLGGNFNGTNIVAYAKKTTGLGTEETANLKLPQANSFNVPDASDETIMYSRNNTVYLETLSANPIKQVYVYNLQGRLIHANARVNATAYSFEGNNVTEIYIVKVVTGQGTKYRKLVNNTK